jgi:MFS family permease
MMEKEKLRKADMFSGGIIFLFGLWIVSQAVKMPMKDSWGGVQNVWFVSPALFPLFVGAMIMLLGVLLIRIAYREVGPEESKRVLRWLGSPDLLRFLKTAPLLRFYAIVVLFFSFVYVTIPRIDFFLCSVLFLVVFISMFYFDDDALLKKMLFFYLSGTILLVVFLASGLSAALTSVLPYPGDWFVFAFIVAYCSYVRTLIRDDPALRLKFKTSLILSVATPFLIGPIFKYLLLVPMPKEGLVVVLMDAIRYWEF